VVEYVFFMEFILDMPGVFFTDPGNEGIEWSSMRSMLGKGLSEERGASCMT
jgi:hypothetical protein